MYSYTTKYSNHINYNVPLVIIVITISTPVLPYLFAVLTAATT